MSAPTAETMKPAQENARSIEMRVRSVSSILLAGFLTISAASGQTPPTADDPHHPATEEGTAATAEGDVAPQPATPSGGAGMGAMMSPEMMQMMMQMMAQHHPAGQVPMAGTAGGMQSGMATDAGPEAILGLAPAATPEMTPDKVQTWLQGQLDRLGNPRLVLGAIGEAPDGSITAEIRTVDGALVQKLAFNRFPGFVRQID
jgi:hypothetical protein